MTSEIGRDRVGSSWSDRGMLRGRRREARGARSWQEGLEGGWSASVGLCRVQAEAGRPARCSLHQLQQAAGRTAPPAAEASAAKLEADHDHMRVDFQRVCGNLPKKASHPRTRPQKTGMASSARVHDARRDKSGRSGPRISTSTAGGTRSGGLPEARSSRETLTRAHGFASSDEPRRRGPLV